MVTRLDSESKANAADGSVNSAEGLAMARSSNKRLRLVASIFLGGSAGVPYLKPAYDLVGNKNTMLGIISAGATLIVFASDSCWCWHGLLKYLQGSNIGCRGEIFRPIIATISSILSSTLSFYVVYHYNQDSIIYPILMLVNNFGLTTFGFLQALIPSVFSSVTEVDYRVDLVEESKCEKTSKNAIVILPIANLIVNSVLGFKAASTVTHSDMARGTFAFFSSVSNFAMEVSTSRAMVKKIFEPPRRRSARRRIGRSIFLFFSFISVLFASSSRVFVIFDNFDKGAAVALSILGTASALLFEQFIAVDIFKNGYENNEISEYNQLTP